MYQEATILTVLEGEEVSTEETQSLPTAQECTQLPTARPLFNLEMKDKFVIVSYLSLIVTLSLSIYGIIYSFIIRGDGIESDLATISIFGLLITLFAIYVISLKVCN